MQISSDDCRPWVFVAPRAAPICCFHDQVVARIRPINPVIAADISVYDLKARDLEALPADLLRGSARWIDREPSLAAICAQLVEEIHLLQSEPGYDVSHSEPRWRRRIFVSIPDRADGVGALRLAENIIHEAMHLHLTDFEQEQPLVQDLADLMKSPWRQELRSRQGVIHGLFVFVCLRDYFRRIEEGKVRRSAERSHCEKRISEIDTEIAAIDWLRLVDGLTATGQLLATRLIEVASVL